MSLLLIEPSGKTDVATGAVGQQIVMKTARHPADAGRIPVLGARRILSMPRGVQRFGDQRSLQRDVLRTA